MKSVRAADLFCGAGGTSTGLLDACRDAGYDLELIAINHWDVAIETHSLNHPYAKHLCQSVDAVNPRDLVPSGRLHLMVASPECIHHSVARGGRPINDQSRTSAWHILRWAEALYIDNILIENVKEFRNWGPLGANGRPLKSKCGETYRCFLEALRSLGYRVEDRVLNAADYGDPTTRERLFIIARRGNRPITWPQATHTPDGATTLFGPTRKWRAAREIIDWDLKGQSIFDRKRPLSPSTLARIVAGLRKFNGPQLEPFLVKLYGTADVASVEKPVPTVTANGNHLAVCEPFVLQQQSGGAPRSVKEPIPTVATKGAIALIQPFIIGHPRQKNGVNNTPIDSIDKPLRTVTATSCDFSLVEPFLVAAGGPQGKGRNPKSVDDPLETVLTENHTALVEPYLVSVNHGDGAERRTHDLDEPVPTVTTRNGYGLVEPFLVKYFGTAKAVSVNDPLDTVTTKDRFGLVTGDGYRLDIRFRMLKPYELARAQGFPDDYVFSGGSAEKTKQIGNAVPVNLAKALCASLL